MTSDDLSFPSTAGSCVLHARHYERGPVAIRDLEKALRLYERAISIAEPESRHLLTAMRGAVRILEMRKQYRMADIYRRELDLMKERRQQHPKQRQLFISEENLLKLPYLRKHTVTGGSPGRFNPKKPHFGGQILIAAVVWHRRLSAYGHSPYWEADVYWLAEHDAPFSDQCYRGWNSRPYEGVRPTEVLAAVRGLDDNIPANLPGGDR